MHVLADNGELVGVVSVIRLLQADGDAAVESIMDDDPVRVAPQADLTDVALLMADYNLALIPVVDEGDRVLGVVTYDDVLAALIPRIGGGVNRPRGRSVRPRRTPTESRHE